MSRQKQATQSRLEVPKSCGTCGSTDNLVVLAGGPFGWLCKNCHEIIDRFIEGAEKHEKWWVKVFFDNRKNFKVKVIIPCAGCRKPITLTRKDLDDGNISVMSKFVTMSIKARNKHGCK